MNQIIYICNRCGGDLTDNNGKRYCETCRKRDSENRRYKTSMRANNHMCTRCGAELPIDYHNKSCLNCLEWYRARYNRRNNKEVKPMNLFNRNSKCEWMKKAGRTSNGTVYVYTTCSKCGLGARYKTDNGEWRLLDMRDMPYCPNCGRKVSN